MDRKAPKYLGRTLGLLTGLAGIVAPTYGSAETPESQTYSHISMDEPETGRYGLDYQGRMELNYNTRDYSANRLC